MVLKIVTQLFFIISVLKGDFNINKIVIKEFQYF